MARRWQRATESPAGDLDEPPRELLGPAAVEDWVSPDERPPGYWSGDTLLEWFRITAWRRQSNARRAWLDERDVPRLERTKILPFTGAPKFRDWRTYAPNDDRYR